MVSIGQRALSNLTALRELYCSHNTLLEHIDGSALSHQSFGQEEGETWPPLFKVP